MKIALTFDDGTTVETDKADRKTFFGIASKAAFKKQFGVPTIVLSIMSQAMGEEDDDGDRTMDLSKVPAEHLQYMDDQYLAFLAWLELKRRNDDTPSGSWDGLVEKLVDVTLEFDQEDPPETAATST